MAVTYMQQWLGGNLITLPSILTQLIGTDETELHYLKTADANCRLNAVVQHTADADANDLKEVILATDESTTAEYIILNDMYNQNILMDQNDTDVATLTDTFDNGTIVRCRRIKKQVIQATVVENAGIIPINNPMVLGGSGRWKIHPDDLAASTIVTGTTGDGDADTYAATISGVAKNIVTGKLKCQITDETSVQYVVIEVD